MKSYSAMSVFVSCSHTRSVAYSVALVLLNKHHILGGGAYPDCYQIHWQTNSRSVKSRTGQLAD